MILGAKRASLAVLPEDHPRQIERPADDDAGLGRLHADRM